MTPTIEDIIARFGREGWVVQKTRENFWVVRPKGVFDYKIFLLTYNPFTDQYQIVKSLTPNDPHYEKAVKILEGSRAKGEKRARPSNLSKVSHDLSIIKVPSMFPVKISPMKWINLADAREISLTPEGGLFVVWSSGDYTTFEGEEADIAFKALNEAYETALKRLHSAA
jgi:hypothetical protein